MVCIEGYEKLQQIMGVSSSLHGSEVLSINLDRDKPSATFSLLVPEYNNKVITRCFEVGFEFCDIDKLHLESFNHQNVVSSLSFEEILDEHEYSFKTSQRIHVVLDIVFGVWSTFNCSSVEVTFVRISLRKTGDPSFNRPALELESVAANPRSGNATSVGKAQLKSRILW